MKMNWDDIFRQTERSLAIQNVKPPHETARNIFADDEKAIMAAASRYGFKIVSPPKAKVISFVKK